jgi:uncharacterized membrane protein
VSVAIRDYRFATVSPQGVEWKLKRNCSVSPAQMCGVLVLLGSVSLLVAAFFWMQGATLVLPFAVLEVLALAIAVVVFAKHAADVERISLAGGRLVVELESGGKSERAEFAREWVRVEPQSGDGSLIHVSGQGRTVVVGRHVRADLRPLLAREIRQALRGV